MLLFQYFNSEFAEFEMFHVPEHDQQYENYETVIKQQQMREGVLASATRGSCTLFLRPISPESSAAGPIHSVRLAGLPLTCREYDLVLVHCPYYVYVIYIVVTVLSTARDSRHSHRYRSRWSSHWSSACRVLLAQRRCRGDETRPNDSW